MKVSIAAVLLAASLPIFAWAAPAAAPPSAGMQATEMSQMAQAMTRMAEMCEMMMKQEMAGRPFKTAAAVVLVILLIVDLSLLAFLQIHWLRHWRTRLRTQREP